MERFFILVTKSGKKKEEVGTKVGMGWKCRDENNISA